VDRARLEQIARKLKQDYGAQKVLLFGSVARGTADADSDIDLLVISPTSEEFFERMATVHRLLRDVCRGIPISPIVLTPEEAKARIALGDQFISDIVSHGVEL
jgi:predicted nucleotidyltransferase